MVTADPRHSAPAAPAEQHFPPVIELAVASMACVIAAGIFLASYLPKTAPLAVPAVLFAVAVVLLLAAVSVLARIPAFAWYRFRQVVLWCFVAYLVIAGLLAYIFIDDGVRGGTALVLLGSLAVYAVDIPLVLAFTVARYAPVTPDR